MDNYKKTMSYKNKTSVNIKYDKFTKSLIWYSIIFYKLKNLLLEISGSRPVRRLTYLSGSQSVTFNKILSFSPHCTIVLKGI